MRRKEYTDRVRYSSAVCEFGGGKNQFFRVVGEEVEARNSRGLIMNVPRRGNNNKCGRSVGFHIVHVWARGRAQSHLRKGSKDLIIIKQLFKLVPRPDSIRHR